MIHRREEVVGGYYRDPDDPNDAGTWTRRRAGMFGDRPALGTVRFLGDGLYYLSSIYWAGEMEGWRKLPSVP